MTGALYKGSQGTPSSQPSPVRSPINTCAVGCLPKGMELAGTADTAEVSGNRALTCIPPWAQASVIIFEDRGTTDKVIVTRDAACGQVERVCAPERGPQHHDSSGQRAQAHGIRGLGVTISAASRPFYANWPLLGALS